MSKTQKSVKMNNKLLNSRMEDKFKTSFKAIIVGFAVVADQIGKLAADSAQSAVTTRELIVKSLGEIEVGNYIVEKSMEAITQVLANMESFATMASGVAESSKEQVEMLRQIEDGIVQITLGVQSNSATAGETSAVSEELAAQATGLEEMLEKFVLCK